MRAHLDVLVNTPVSHALSRQTLYSLVPDLYTPARQHLELILYSLVLGGFHLQGAGVQTWSLHRWCHSLDTPGKSHMLFVQWLLNHL